MDSYPEVNRVEVIDSNGRALTRYGVTNVHVDLQDGGRTLKVFLDSSWRMDRPGD